MNKSTKKKLYNRWVDADFRWVIPSALGVSAVVLTVLDAIDPNTPDYRMWSVGCVVAMLLYAIHVGPKP